MLGMFSLECEELQAPPESDLDLQQPQKALNQSILGAKRGEEILLLGRFGAFQ